MMWRIFLAGFALMLQTSAVQAQSARAVGECDQRIIDAIGQVYNGKEPVIVMMVLKKTSGEEAKKHLKRCFGTGADIVPEHKLDWSAMTPDPGRGGTLIRRDDIEYYDARNAFILEDEGNYQEKAVTEATAAAPSYTRCVTYKIGGDLKVFCW